MLQNAFQIIVASFSEIKPYNTEKLKINTFLGNETVTKYSKRGLISIGDDLLKFLRNTK